MREDTHEQQAVSDALLLLKGTHLTTNAANILIAGAHGLLTQAFVMYKLPTQDQGDWFLPAQAGTPVTLQL